MKPARSPLEIIWIVLAILAPLLIVLAARYLR